MSQGAISGSIIYGAGMIQDEQYWFQKFMEGIHYMSKITLKITSNLVVPKLLKYGLICKKSLLKDESLTRYCKVPQSKEKKAFNWPEFHLSEVTSYIIHILVV